MSPYRFSKTPIYIGGLIGFIMSVVLLIALAPVPGTVLFNKALLTSAVTIMTGACLGWGASLTSGKVFNEKVINPVQSIDEYAVGLTYWLNGNHPVKFLGLDTYTGELKFQISGINNYANADDYELIYPGRAMEYISPIQEN